MKHDHWVRFTWNIAALADLPTDLPEHYEIARVEAADEKEVRDVFAKAFTLDPAWNAAIHEITPLVETWLDHAFASELASVLALRHGTRIIGAAAIIADSANDHQIGPGPCILIEYRNRGFGTRLLAHALSSLRDAGLREASTIAKESSPVAKFLYPKFGSIAAPYDFTPLVAA